MEQVSLQYFYSAFILTIKKEHFRARTILRHTYTKMRKAVV